MTDTTGAPEKHAQEKEPSPSLLSDLHGEETALPGKEASCDVATGAPGSVVAGDQHSQTSQSMQTPTTAAIGLLLAQLSLRAQMSTRIVGSPYFSPPRTFADTDAGGEVTVTNMRVGCLNVRGFKSNCDYCALLLKSLDILAISEHWLHNFDLKILQKAYPDFNAYATCHREEEDNLICAPRYIHGNGGVAILWRKTLQANVHKLIDISTDRVVGNYCISPDLFLICLYADSLRMY